MLKYKYLLLFTLFASTLLAQDYSYMYRVELINKETANPFRIDRAEEYLSPKAIDRRYKQGIAIDSTDLPVSADYISQIELMGGTIVAKSKWMNTVSVHCTDSSFVDSLTQLSFVKNVTLAWKGVSSSRKYKIEKPKRIVKSNAEDYGAAYDQIAMHKGNYLHENGYKGKGMEIAVLDAGYNSLPENLLLSNISIKGTKDFVYEGGDMFESGKHGVYVLSAMAGNIPNTYIGTAPETQYWLFRTEDSRSEFPIEEDYWVAATEYADSVGVDIINSSLGYTLYNAPCESPTHDDLDGKTRPITIGAEMAVSKGMFVVSSAGNDGDKKWVKISFPADAENVLTVGAVKRDSIVGAFSSRGSTADGRIKPDVMAVGVKATLINEKGEVVQNDGTSFSSPVMCGLVACLWQAFPKLSSLELLEIIKKSANRYNNPNNDYGYGIPDMQKAASLANNITSIETAEIGEAELEYKISADSTGITITKDNDSICSVLIFDIEGKMILSDYFTENEMKYPLSRENKGLLVIQINNKNTSKSHKVFF